MTEVSGGETIALELACTAVHIVLTALIQTPGVTACPDDPVATAADAADRMLARQWGWLQVHNTLHERLKEGLDAARGANPTTAILALLDARELCKPLLAPGAWNTLPLPPRIGAPPTAVV